MSAALAELPAGRDGQWGYTAAQVLAATGISYRQLDYWTRTGHLPKSDQTPGSGNWRAYTRRDLDICRYVKSLLDAGLTLDPAFEAARHLVGDGHASIVSGACRIVIIPEGAVT